jgi:hypothetical protein
VLIAPTSIDPNGDRRLVRLRALFVFSMLTGACAPAAPQTHAPPTASPKTPPAVPGAPALRYEIAASGDGSELTVEASLGSGTGTHLAVARDATPFVRNVEVAGARGWQPVEAAADSWPTPECANGCRVRYRFGLRDAARAVDDLDTALTVGASFEAPPATWLLAPDHPPEGTRYRFHVSAAPPIAFESGVWPTAHQPGTYEGDASDLDNAPYSIFGPMHVRSLEPEHVVVAFESGAFAIGDAGIEQWVATNAHAIGSFYERFPVPHLLVIVGATAGTNLSEGKTLGNGGAAIFVRLGKNTDRQTLAANWVLAHEMVHTALPGLEPEHHWLEEGLADYVEPLARAQAGIIGPERVWKELVEGLPQGLPDAHGRGLDHSPTWASTYWGGALFCFLADLEIRKRTNNTRSLDDALRGVNSAGGNIGEVWGLERVIQVGDHATGTSVLRELHDKMGDRPMKVNLDGIWKELGIAMSDGHVRFDDGAPSAQIRRALTAAR